MAIATCSYCVRIEIYVLCVQGADLALAEMSLAGLASEGLALVSGLAAAKTCTCRLADAAMTCRWHMLQGGLPLMALQRHQADHLPHSEYM